MMRQSSAASAADQHRQWMVLAILPDRLKPGLREQRGPLGNRQTIVGKPLQLVALRFGCKTDERPHERVAHQRTMPSLATPQRMADVRHGYDQPTVRLEHADKRPQACWQIIEIFEHARADHGIECSSPIPRVLAAKSDVLSEPPIPVR